MAAPWHSTLPLSDLVCLVWFALDAFTHFIIEGVWQLRFMSSRCILCPSAIG